MLGAPTLATSGELSFAYRARPVTTYSYDLLGVRREKALSSAGAKPARQLSLRPEAIEAIVEETKRLKPSV